MPIKLGNEEHYKPREVAAVLNKDYQTVLRYIRQQDIGYKEVYQRYLIPHSDLVEYLEDSESLEASIIEKIISSRLSTSNISKSQK